jgi:hypothetical protein
MDIKSRMSVKVDNEWRDFTRGVVLCFGRVMVVVMMAVLLTLERERHRR